MLIWATLAVGVCAGVVCVWWLVSRAGTKQRQADERRKRYALGETAGRLPLNSAQGRAASDSVSITEINPPDAPPKPAPPGGARMTGRLVHTTDGEKILTTPPFDLRASLLGTRGSEYFAQLYSRVPAWVVVCPKVRLDAIVTATSPAGRDALDWATWRRRVRMRSVDFLLCDRRSFKPLLAIVFERHSKRAHLQPGGGQDRIPDEVLQGAGLPLLRLSGHFEHDWGLIKPHVDQVILPTVSEDAIDRAHWPEVAALFDDGVDELTDGDKR